MIEEYNYNEKESGRTETLIKALDKIELLEKQLDIATKALNKYANRNNWYNVYRQNSLDEYPLYWYNKYHKEFGYKEAQRALKKMEKIKNETVISEYKSK